jgi:hypothetical protein
MRDYHDHDVEKLFVELNIVSLYIPVNAAKKRNVY